MNRVTAKDFVGQTVHAWTAANGEYTGTLEEVIELPRRPWRAKVSITSVDAPAIFELRRYKQRRGFRIGECIEVSGVNVFPGTSTDDTQSYLSVLRAEHSKLVQWLARSDVNPKDRRWLPLAIKWRREQIEKIESGEWK